jgi:hypothetical protein
MMKTIVRSLALFSVFFLSLADARAGATKNGNYVVYDRGQDTCGQYLDARRNDQQEATIYLIWMAGYVTAYNRFVPDTSDILNTTPSSNPAPLSGTMQWLENYCVARPMAPFMEAVVAFINSRRPYRKK